jgi:hypothetical protein
MNTPPHPDNSVAATLHGIPASRAPFATDSDPIMPLNVVVAYGDAPAAKQAMRALRRLGTRLAAPTALKPIHGRFDLLEDPCWRALATADADAADFIIFATSHADRLPDAVNSWSSECVTRKRGERLAVVTLFGADEAWAVWIQDESQISTKRQSAPARAVALLAFEEVPMPTHTAHSPAHGKSSPASGPPVDEHVRVRAYYLWLERGCPHGEDGDHWFAAQRQLLATMTAAIVEAPPRADDGPARFSIRQTVAEHLSDPTHRFHPPGAAHDNRLDVIAGEARQRVRGRRFGGSLRPQPKSRSESRG